MVCQAHWVMFPHHVTLPIESIPCSVNDDSRHMGNMIDMHAMYLLIYVGGTSPIDINIHSQVPVCFPLK
jgi:hypothetical protein